MAHITSEKHSGCTFNSAGQGLTTDLFILVLLQWKFEKRYLLTGTPVQNNLKELHALLSFISSRKFDPNDAEDFVEKYSDMDDSGKSFIHKHRPPGKSV